MSKSTNTAKMAERGLTNTGFTESMAKAFHDQLGKTGVAVIEFVADSRGENRNGDESVKLSMLTVEVAPTKETEDHLRNLAAAFHYERKLTEDGPQLLEPGDGPAPKVSDVLQHGKGVLTETDDGEPRLLTDDDLEDPQLEVDDPEG